MRIVESSHLQRFAGFSYGYTHKDLHEFKYGFTLSIFCKYIYASKDAHLREVTWIWGIYEDLRGFKFTLDLRTRSEFTWIYYFSDLHGFFPQLYKAYLIVWKLSLESQFTLKKRC